MARGFVLGARSFTALALLAFLLTAPVLAATSYVPTNAALGHLFYQKACFAYNAEVVDQLFLSGNVIYGIPVEI